MLSFYYQIKGKAGKEDKVINEQYAFFNGNNNSFSTWVWPPIFSGKVEANNKKEAELVIEELYNKKFPLRVLKKDLESNEFLLKIEEIKENSYTDNLFKDRICENEDCKKIYTIIEKYNDDEQLDKGHRYCSKDCRDISQEKYRNKLIENYELEGVHNPVIYKITNKLTNMIYIGKTTQAFTLRWYQHFFQSNNCKFHESIKSSKLEDWIFEVIETIVISDDIKNNKEEINKLINERERYYIDLYNCIYPNGYNSI